MATTGQRPVIALSLKARGLTVTPTIPRTRQLLPNLAQSIIDISIAICVQIVLLSWSAWISVLLSILCCVFWANYRDGAMAAADGSIMIPIALLIYLPCLGLVYTTAKRRLAAQQHLEQVQSYVVGAYALHASLGGCGAQELLMALDDAISDTMLQVQGYLSQPRSITATHFGTGLLKGEVLPANSRLLACGTDMGQRLRQVHSCVRRLMDTAATLLAHCSDTKTGRMYRHQALALVQVVMPLTTSIQALLSVKDLRSPLLLRAMLRPAVVLIAPLLQGSVLAGAGIIGRPVTAAGQVYAIVVGCILQVLLMSLYTLGTMLEDPFDTGAAAAPDTLSLTEFMHTLAYLTAPDPGLDTVESSEVTVSIKPSPSQPGSAPPSTTTLEGNPQALARLSIDSSDAEGERDTAVTPTAAAAAAAMSPRAAAAPAKAGVTVPMSAQERMAQLLVRSSPPPVKPNEGKGGQGKGVKGGEGDRESRSGQPSSHP